MMKIEVTQDDINKGKQSNPESCAIARAVKRIAGDHPHVDGSSIDVTIAGRWCVYNVPKTVSTFVDRFDTDKKAVKPFVFTARLDKDSSEAAIQE